MALKAGNCKKLHLETFWKYRVNELSRGRWLDLADKICQTSTGMEHLIIKNTATTAQQGKTFLQNFAKATQLSTLKTVDFSGGIQVFINKSSSI